ncbi:MAG: hypothetical protein LC808_02675 [Actinobacteria bacterium]|nr:hypothetical protein [Actinomycetota bacterium]
MRTGQGWGASAQLNRVGEHAVVLGASVSGLLAARVLADAFDRVTVIERDPVSERSVAARRGVPQGRHAHGLLSRGAQIFAELFPGLLEDLVAEGAPVISAPDELRSNLSGHLLCMTGRYTDLTDTYQPSRPHLESALRTRVQGLPNVKLVDGCQVVGLETTADNERVTGVQLRYADNGAADTVLADLVVDATGRSGRSTKWLAGMGYEPPVEEKLQVDILYVSQHLRPVPGSTGVGSWNSPSRSSRRTSSRRSGTQSRSATSWRTGFRRACAAGTSGCPVSRRAWSWSVMRSAASTRSTPRA